LYWAKRRLAVTKLELMAIGDSVGIVLPEDVLAQLNAREGDFLFLTEAPDGFRITPYDPDFEEQMELARKVMRERRDLLRELAK
jgi:putative addiction module antidote